MKVYVPVDDLSDYSCYTIFDANTIRAYKNNLQVGNNDYTDFYISSHYLSKDGTQIIESTQEFPICSQATNITNDYWYRLDLAHCVIIVMFFVIFIYFTFKVFSRMFGRWLKI